MDALPDELRLIVAIALNALVFASAARFVRRLGVRDGCQVALDAFLLWYLVQYTSVALPGLFGVLSVGSMIGIALAISALLLVAPSRLPRTDRPAAMPQGIERHFLAAGCAAVCAFAASLIWNQRGAPPTANDALTYHLPAAVQWLQTGRLGLLQTWFFNPANTYSPLGGSTFMVWLMAPLKNDVLAQFVEAPALVMIFFACVQICRTLGASLMIASLIAVACCCARPFISQTVLTKDDLFVTAFFGASVAALARPQLQDRFGALRLGTALGLLLAMKYTALLCVPMLLTAIDAPHRADWRRRDYAFAATAALLFAGPWFLRNLILTGNPFFPIKLPLLPGMFTTARDVSFATLKGTWHVFVGGYSGVPLLPARALIVVWVIALVCAGRSTLRCPLTRLVLLAPEIGIGIFIAVSPFAEIRFVYPCFLLLFAAAALAFAWMPRIAATASACLLIACSASTSFKYGVLLELAVPLVFCLGAAGVMAAVVQIALTARPAPWKRWFTLVASIGITLSLLGVTFVYWHHFLDQRKNDACDYWKIPYGQLAEVWAFAREQAPAAAGATIAYADTSFIYPLFGAEFDHRVIYVPVRDDVRTIADLGHIGQKIAGNDLPTGTTLAMIRGADGAAWARRLRASGASMLLIARHPPGAPEMEFAREIGLMPAFENSAGVVYLFHPD